MAFLCIHTIESPITLSDISFFPALGIFPPFPPVEQVDFSLLTDEACNTYLMFVLTDEACNAYLMFVLIHIANRRMLYERCCVLWGRPLEIEYVVHILLTVLEP